MKSYQCRNKTVGVFFSVIMTSVAVNQQVSHLTQEIEALQCSVDIAATFEARRELRAQIRELKAQIKGTTLVYI